MASVVISVSILGGRGNLLLTAQKPPIGWRLKTRAGELGSELSGGAAVPLSSGTCAWHAPREPLYWGRRSPRCGRSRQILVRPAQQYKWLGEHTNGDTQEGSPLANYAATPHEGWSGGAEGMQVASRCRHSALVGSHAHRNPLWPCHPDQASRQTLRLASARSPRSR
eukprot:3265308-Prymnesium_polylepis.2